ncbi:GNAT family N-acetyltransferase [Alteromonas sp. ASW11-19]|uniref:GNAT family N-acetyltransferase n=1 Tax=Alteromonas salexigens TaxID=2982530 RepID=A0ABT2VPM9_9ALTE|nr:GNAT family N-acetyltransferase [Alteromonas salexigens]MCU7555265.1 GNAT family N-acetyltransferase [Alteromonas salexigens]
MYIDDSERLSFEPVSEKDAEFLWSIDQDEEVMRFLNGGKKTTREEVTGVFIPRIKAFSNPALGWGVWRVTEKATSEDVGWILVRPMLFFTATPQTDNLELGWRFKRHTWGRGLATEAARTVRDALFDMGVEKFSATATPDNTASIAVMKKLGMEYSHEIDYEDEVFQGRLVVYNQDLSRIVSF